VPKKSTRATLKPAPVAKAKIIKPAISKPDMPMSESLDKIRDPWTAQQCIDELRRVCSLDPDKVVSRNYFRVHGRIAESVWNAHFGTFHEFKRQASIVLSRQQHIHERKIAKHASVDHYRRLAAERSDWGDKYLRPNNKDFQLGMFCSDLHDKEIDPFFLRVWLDTVKRSQPDLVSFVGDIMDLPEFGKYAVDPRDWNPVKRIEFALDKIYRPTREAAPDAQIDSIEGNHEFRILRHFADATPALRAVLADFHGMDMQKLFKLDELNINWVGKADLAAYTESDVKKELRKNYRVYWDCFLAHHFPQGKAMGMPGVNGHHHTHEVWTEHSAIFGSYEWHQMGSGHRRDASYCEGEKWNNGFAIVHVHKPTRSVNIEYIPITDIAVVGGKMYVREPHEVVNRPFITPPSRNLLTGVDSFI
jgi:hypothetical protein